MFELLVDLQIKDAEVDGNVRSYT